MKNTGPTTTKDPTGYVGLTKDAAIAKAKIHNQEIRISSTDGKFNMLTSDMKQFRINLHIEDEIVKSVTFG